MSDSLAAISSYCLRTMLSFGESAQPASISAGKNVSFRQLKKVAVAERVYQLEIARNLIPRSIASKYLMADAPDLPERLKTPPFTWHRMRMFFASAKYLRDMAWLIKISSQPWPGPLDELNAVKSKSPAKPGSLIPAVSVLSRLTAETLAIVRCTTSAIAIERYRLQNGRLPDSLADICPTYIKSIPPDPFTGQTLLYTHDDQSYTVYSTGVNRIDDKGAITGKARPAGSRHRASVSGWVLLNNQLEYR